jgi:site-specific DNA-methyltransferase (adenine-specific)
MPVSEVFNADCMDIMKQYPDKFFELAIVDPPYGIGFDGQKRSTSKHGGRREIAFKGWDNSAPKSEYFFELFRVSKNQIIWGANFFPKELHPSMGWIFWDKGQRICNSDGELAFSSFDRALRVFTLNRAYIQEQGGGFHPTQKPIRLYKWLLENYAKQGDKILDTHMGSQSSRIAAYKMGFDFYGCEIDTEYFEKGNERFKTETAEPLFSELSIIQTSINFDDQQAA